MSNANRPAWYHAMAFNADPNDPIALPVWVENTTSVRGFDRAGRGRNYELDRPVAADPTVDVRDPDEYLNPANTSSPYWPLIQPYRQMLHMCTWPNAGTGNLMNANTWRPDGTGMDGSLESYDAGETVPWIAHNSGAVTPVVSTSNPWQGTKSLQYDTFASSAQQGVYWRVPTVPGVQYTASLYVRQTSAQTQAIEIMDQVVLSDVFPRNTVSGLGSADAPLAMGGTWTAVSPAASAFGTVKGNASDPTGYATLTCSANQTAIATSAATALSPVVRTRFRVPAVATGSNYRFGVCGRYVDANNFYWGAIQFDLLGKMTVQVLERAAGADSVIGVSYLVPGYYQAGDILNLELSIQRETLLCKAWRDGEPEPTGGQATATDATLTAAGPVGLVFHVPSSNTNGTFGPRVYVMAATDRLRGTTTTTAGSYVRLSATWTATADSHRILLSTVGTAVNATVNLDGLQVERGAAASTFTTTGACDYPIFRNYSERYPRDWMFVGFEGQTRVPAVDAMAAMAAIGLRPEYEMELLGTGPDHVWSLSGGGNNASYPDSSGNDGPMLQPSISKYGTGQAVQGGVAMDIPGGGGTTGAGFTPSSPGTMTQAATILAAGRWANPGPTPGITFPRQYGSSTDVWGATVAAWVSLTTTSPTSQQVIAYPFTLVNAALTQYWVPISIAVSSAGRPQAVTITPTGSATATASADINVYDGQPHLLIATIDQDPLGNTDVVIHVDGEPVGAASVTTASLGGPYRSTADSIDVGGNFDGTYFGGIANGGISWVSLWSRSISSLEIGNLWLAGGTGFAGESSLSRFQAHLEQSGYTGPYRVSPDPSTAISNPGLYPDGPVSTMGAPTWSGGISLLQDSLNTTVAEQGCMWVAPNGAVTLEGRWVRYNRLTPEWELGEDEPGGEAPYLPDIRFDYDPMYVFADVVAQRNDGAAAVGGLAPDIAATARRYFPRSYRVNADWYTDDQAQDAADWIYYSHRLAGLRVERVTLDPASNPDLWPLVLGIEVGRRVRLYRRAKAANGGAGIVMQGDYFVENVCHTDVNYEAGTWLTELLLSPIGTGPGVTVQPWILDDTTLSVLDSTTIPAF